MDFKSTLKQNIVLDENELFKTSLSNFVLQRIRLRAKRRIIWLRKIWEQTGQNGKVNHTVHSEVDVYLNNADNPLAEAKWQKKEESIQELNTEIVKTDQSISDLPNSRFEKLKSLFQLSDTEIDILHCCFALKLEGNIGKVYAYLQDHPGRGYVTDELVARLFGYGRTLLLDEDSPLKKWRLVYEKNGIKGEPNYFEIDPYIFNWLSGLNGIDNALSDVAYRLPLHSPLSGWPIKNVLVELIKLRNSDPSQKIRVIVTGLSGSGKKSLAVYLSHKLEKGSLVIDGNRIPSDQMNGINVYIQRQAFLTKTPVIWTGENVLNYRPINSDNLYGLQFIICESSQFPIPISDVIDLRIEIPALSIEERRKLWKEFMPFSAKWDRKDFSELLERYQSNIGQIRSVARSRNTHLEGARNSLRELTRYQLDGLAQMLDCPFVWEDLILPEWLKSYLEQFVFEATERNYLWEEVNAKRLFPQGKGLIALFSGPPGTGKTMASQVIAARLGLDLFRIDLSTIVSKYVGETSKNIEKILTRAERMNAVLLFDEADALFGKRTDVKDAHDRFANTDTNYLLQAIESYPGLAILATNKKSNIDSGFLRRLRYVLEFPKPDKANREIIWTKIIQELVGLKDYESIKNKISGLAETIELSGAQIKFAVLSAIYLARQDKSELKINHILSGVEQEMMKEGDGISQRVKELLLK